MAKRSSQPGSPTQVYLDEHSTVVLLCVLGIALACSIWHAAAFGLHHSPRPPLSSTVDPNIAPWYELTILPRIGRGTALEIIAHREQAAFASTDGRAYMCPADLDDVPGIGIKTIEGMAPYLRFPSHTTSPGAAFKPN